MNRCSGSDPRGRDVSRRCQSRRQHNLRRLAVEPVIQAEPLFCGCRAPYDGVPTGVYAGGGTARQLLYVNLTGRGRYVIKLLAGTAVNGTIKLRKGANVETRGAQYRGEHGHTNRDP